jgi:hypothetical protein
MKGTVMHNKLKLASQAALAVAVVHDFVVHVRMKRACKELAESNTLLHDIHGVLVEECNSLNERLQAAETQRAYLLEMLDKHEVPATEFDLIVLNSLTQ